MNPVSTTTLALVLALIGSSLMAEGGPNLIGRASAIDGDTIEIHGSRIRLQSIDAPESGQLCRDREGRAWRCGQAAAIALSDRIGTRPVSCVANGYDRYGRVLARCSVSGQDLSAWMVRQGWAIRYYDRAGRHRAVENEAQQMQRGIWSGTFDTPSAWRQNRVR